MNDTDERIGHLETITEKHEREIAELRDMDNKIVAEMAALRKLTEGQNSDLREIKELAFRSTPPDVTQRIQLQMLVWQILAVCVTATAVLVGIVEWAGKSH